MERNGLRKEALRTITWALPSWKLHVLYFVLFQTVPRLWITHKIASCATCNWPSIWYKYLLLNFINYKSCQYVMLVFPILLVSFLCSNPLSNALSLHSQSVRTLLGFVRVSRFTFLPERFEVSIFSRVMRLKFELRFLVNDRQLIISRCLRLSNEMRSGLKTSKRLQSRTMPNCQPKIER